MRTPLAALAIAAVPAAAFPVELQVDNECWDVLGSPLNQERTIDVADLIGIGSGARVDITGVSWNVTIRTGFSGSWLSEASVFFDDPDAFPTEFNAFFISPGLGVDNPGTQSFSSGGIVSLDETLQLDNGRLRIEFFETFDDFSGEPDAEIEGTITIHLPVEPDCGPADLAEPIGILDLADVTAFVTAFMNQDPAADLAAPQGVLDLADVVAFAAAFSDGCG